MYACIQTFLFLSGIGFLILSAHSIDKKESYSTPEEKEALIAQSDMTTYLCVFLFVLLTSLGFFNMGIQIRRDAASIIRQEESSYELSPSRASSAIYHIDALYTNHDYKDASKITEWYKALYAKHRKKKDNDAFLSKLPLKLQQ